MNWGVTAILYENGRDDADRLDFGIGWARERGMVEPGDLVVATAGISSETGSTDMVRLVRVSASD